MEKEPNVIVLEGYHILLKFGDLKATTMNRKIGTHEEDGCLGGVYLRKNKDGFYVTCKNWSIVRCHLFHPIPFEVDVSNFAKLIAYAKSLAPVQKK